MKIRSLFGALAVLLLIASAGDAAPRHSFTWSGDVDDTVDVVVRRNSVRVIVVRGRAVLNQRYSFRGRLPLRRVQFARVTGRGSVRIYQQPRRSNGYATGVIIRDPARGRGHYTFTLD